MIAYCICISKTAERQRILEVEDSWKIVLKHRIKSRGKFSLYLKLSVSTVNMSRRFIISWSLYFSLLRVVFRVIYHVGDHHISVGMDFGDILAQPSQHPAKGRALAEADKARLAIQISTSPGWR